MEIKTIVVGLHHHNNGLVFDRGMKVSVVFDDHNEHSDAAFQVFTEGGLLGGYLAESEFYWRNLAFRNNAILSTELKELINKGYSITDAVVDEIRGRTLKTTKVFIKLTLEKEETTSEEVVSPMGEQPMNMGTISVVGISHYAGNVEEGDICSFRVVKGKTTLVNTENELCGTLPQGERKIAELTAIGAPIVKNRDKREDESFLNGVYTVVNVIEDKYVFLRPFEEEDAVNAPKKDHTGKFTIIEELIAYNLMVKATNKVTQAIIEEETASEEVVLPMEELEMNNIEKELDELNSSIRALKAQKEAIEAEMAAKMARREQLASINAKRNVLIEKIKNGVETLDLSVLEAIDSFMSSSGVEEDTSSSIEEENFVIDFKDHYEERISRFEQSDAQKEDNTCDIVLYYASNTWGNEETIKNVKLSNDVVEYLKSVIPHNQVRGEKVIELEMALETML